MTVLGPEGPVWVELRDSRIATLVAQHHNAVRHYIETGDTSWLDPFKGQTIRVRDGPSIELVTDPERLDRLAEGSELTYDVYLRF